MRNLRYRLCSVKLGHTVARSLSSKKNLEGIDQVRLTLNVSLVIPDDVHDLLLVCPLHGVIVIEEVASRTLCGASTTFFDSERLVDTYIRITHCTRSYSVSPNVYTII